MSNVYAMEESALNKYLSIYDNAALHEAINKYAGQVDYKRHCKKFCVIKKTML